MKKRIVSLPMVLALCLALCLTLLPTSAFAAESNDETIDTSGLCEHHTAHDDTCGYVEGIAESPCTHEHSEECYTTVTSCTHTHTEDCYPVLDDSIPDDEATSSDDESVEDTIPSEATEPTECSHVCSEENGCIKQELDCPHEHDDECGYVPAVEGQPCTYVCTLCGLTEITAWSWVDELEAINPENGVLALSASADSPALYDDIVALLPTEITATTQDGEGTIALSGWTCPDYPEAGAYTGRYKFTAALPDGYALAADAPALTVTVELGGVVMLAGDDHKHCICGAAHQTIGDHTENNEIDFGQALSSYSRDLFIDSKQAKQETIDGRVYNVLPEGNYYLSDNVNIGKSILIKSGTVNICLNGYKLCMNQNTTSYIWEAIQLNGGTLNLTDCKNSGKVYHSDGDYGRGVTVGSDSTSASFTLFGGTICDNKAYASGSDSAKGGGVYIGAKSAFNMYGGKISGNEAQVNGTGRGFGGGVYCYESGTFNLFGGEITKNTVVMYSTDGGYSFGGGVYNQGTFTMSDGRIAENHISSASTEAQFGGGVCNYTPNAHFEMSGGEISKNYIDSPLGGPAYGGGVYNNNKFEFKDGTIDGNYVKSTNSYNVLGGGVCNDDSGQFTMSGGTISNNKAQSSKSSGYGGGVYNKDGVFTMSSGNISGNTASSNGGGIYFDKNKFNLSGGTITGNTAKGNGAGIYIYDSSNVYQTYFYLSGNPVVWDNKTDDKQSNLYMYERYALKTSLTEGAKVGLSLKKVYTDNTMVLVDDSITDDMSGYFASDDSAYKLKTSGHSIIRTSAHTHNWQFTKEEGNHSTVSVSCTGTTGTCEYQTTPATLTISTDKEVYDYAPNMETPVATLTHSAKWPSDLEKAKEADIKYWKSTNGGTSYTVQITNKEALKTPGKYLAQLNFNGEFLDADFSVVDNSKKDPDYTAPTAKTGLTYNGQAQALITPGSATGGTMQYKLDDGPYSTTIPTATAAGTYTVYYKIIGDATHNNVAETAIDVIIRQATPTGTPTFTPVTEAGKTLADVKLTAPTGWPEGTFIWGPLIGSGLSSDTPVTQGTSYPWYFDANDPNYENTYGYLVLWPSSGGGNSGGGNSSDNGSSGGGDSSDNGDSDNSSSNTNPLPTPVTVPVSGDEKTIQVDAAVSGSTATIKNVDLSKLDTVIGDNVKTGIITMDFSALKKVDTVKLPSNVVKQIAEAVNDPNNDAKSLAIALTNGTSIELSAKALGEKSVLANGADIIISLKRIANSSLNSKQKLAVGNRPALDINVTIGGKPISDMNGKITVSASYELKPGEHASGIVVYYIDANGNRKLCETSYDPISKRVSWKTSQLSPSSVYMIGYDESRVKPGTGSYVTYTVQKGNTLSMIAKKHGCTVAEILAANSDLVKNPNRIYVGWQFKIPQD